MTGNIQTLKEIWDASTNVQAFARMVRLGEGTSDDGGYRRIFGGATIVGLDGVPGTADDFADHPRKTITRTMKGKTYTSSAAGAYQIIERTWDGLVKQYGFTNFEPATQDLACVALVAGRGALSLVVQGQFEDAVKKCALEWASLPGSPYGQPVVTMAAAKAEYEKWGGKYEGSATPVPHIEQQQQQERPVAPFIAAALPSIIQAVPELVKVFGGNDPAAVKNEKAAATVMSIAKDALGAKNEQEVVTAIESDADAAASVRKAVQDNWYQLVEVGGGITGAREANLRVQGDRPVYMNPALWFCAALIPLVYIVCLMVLWPDSNFTSEVKAMVISAVVITTLGAMVAYWLGTSASSAKKDDAILNSTTAK